ncbi:MAG: peptide-methionine (R)-S-oxide reductase MsrB [Cyclobacteriaceae bacterium]|nr:peptide-methionine (R)-S-oxide reductase MsrB [Cyclobacteriaceae bacterium HetDA_MAG_MS6]
MHSEQKDRKCLPISLKLVLMIFTLIGMLHAGQAQENKPEELTLSEKEWKAKLTAFEYYVLREKGTERAFSGEYWNNKKEGVYHCAACQLELFSSGTKFKSGTGWPSFYEPLVPANVKEEKDYSFGMTRIEVLCGRCDGHLGHVFPDGPKPTGLRYCINSVSLDFQPKKEE